MNRLVDIIFNSGVAGSSTAARRIPAPSSAPQSKRRDPRIASVPIGGGGCTGAASQLHDGAAPIQFGTHGADMARPWRFPLSAGAGRSRTS